MRVEIGKPTKIDEATSLVSMGHFARICVEIDLKTPLISKFQLRRKVRKIECEVIHLVCFSCGIFNHRNDEYPSEQETTPSESEGSRTDDREDENPSNYQGKVQKMDQHPPINLEVIDNCGYGC